MDRLKEDVESLDGVITYFGELPSGSIVTKNKLAKVFGRHPGTVERAIARGELPPPAKLFGKWAWTSDSIIKHLENRLAIAKQTQENFQKRITKLSMGRGGKLWLA